MALPNVEQSYYRFIRNPEEVLISQTEAYEVWKMAQPSGSSVSIDAFGNFKYKAFMQAVLAGAVEGSQAMGWMEALWRASVRPNSTVKSIIKKMIKHAKEEFWRSVEGGEVKIYDNILASIRYQCRPYFDSIKNGLDI